MHHLVRRSYFAIARVFRWHAGQEIGMIHEDDLQGHWQRCSFPIVTINDHCGPIYKASQRFQFQDRKNYGEEPPDQRLPGLLTAPRPPNDGW